MRLHTVILLLLIYGTAAAAADFERLFTTPEQRRALDALRYQEQTVQVDIPDLQDTDESSDAEQSLAPITVRGLIYRKDAKSAAWINDASTLKGDFSLDDIQVNPRNISSDLVPIRLPTEDRTIELRVGEQYLPSNNRKEDLTP